MQRCIEACCGISRSWKIESAWKESCTVCFGKLRRFGHQSRAFGLSSQYCVFDLHCSLSFCSCRVLARNSLESHPLHSRHLKSISPPLIFLQKEIVQVSVFGIASGTIGERWLQRTNFQLCGQGIQCRPDYIHCRARNVYSRICGDARNFASSYVCCTTH